MSEKGSVWFVTGTSSGFGRSIAEESLSRGDRIVPGAFRTRLFGSAFRALPAMPEYASTVGPTRAYAAQSDGLQGGDPAKAAKAIADAVAAGVPSLRLPLGADAVKSIREKLARVTVDVDAAESVATSTGF